MPANSDNPYESPKAIPPRRNHNAVTKRFNQEDLRTRIAELRAHLYTGMTDLEACEEMGLSVQDYNLIKREMYDQERLQLGKPTEEIFVDYFYQQRGCIRDLDELISRCKVKGDTKGAEGDAGASASVSVSAPKLDAGPISTTLATSVVGAIRAKSDIIEKILTKGQEMGIIKRQPKQTEVKVGVAIAQLDNNALRALVFGAVSDLQKIVEKYGDEDMFANPISPDVIDAAPAAAGSAGPTFTAKGAPKRAIGGLKKSAGARAANSGRGRDKITKPPGGADDGGRPG